MANSAFSPTLTVTGGTTQQGEINVITNPIAQTDTSGWTTSSVTLSRVATGSPLDPEIPTGFQAISTTTTTSYIQTTLQLIAPSLRNRKLKLQFFLALTSSTSWKVDIFKSDGVTRYPLSTDSSAVSVIPALTGTYTTTFDMDTDTGVYVRFTRHAGSGTTTLNFTNLIVGPGIQPQGAVVQEWQNFTPVTFGSTTYSSLTGKYRRIGDSATFRISATINSASGTYWFDLPSGLTIDTTKVRNGNYQDQYGYATYYRSPTVNYIGIVQKTNVANRVRIVGPNGTNEWSQSTNLPTTPATGDGIELEFTVPIAEWSGSGTVQLAQNDVEWASNDGSGGTAANTNYSTGMQYGPSGSSIVAVASTSGGYAITGYKVQFQSPIQNGDRIQVEILGSGATSWVPLEETVFAQNIRGTGYRTGIIVIANDSTSVFVQFGNAGCYSNSATYEAAGAAWSTQTATKWRVRKTSAGAAIGFGLVVPGTSAGLVSASGVPGNTTGNAIASGYVGELLTATWTGQTITTGGGLTLGTITSVSPGIYLAVIEADVTFGSATRITSTIGGTATAVVQKNALGGDYIRQVASTAASLYVTYFVRVTSSGSMTFTSASVTANTTNDARGSFSLIRIA